MQHALNTTGPPDSGDLAAWFGFTPDELALNRAGQLSDRQRQRVFFLSIGYLVRGLAMLILTLILAIYLAPGADQDHEVVLLAVIVGLLVLLTVFMFFAACRVFRPAVETVTGSLARCGKETCPCVCVGDRELTISFRRWKRLKPTYPGQFRAYYCFGNMLLSIEPCPQD
ncbi:MAG: hypothetical protein JXJ20_11480 [Anaerolineae bacterium]|nr:hypothetical protein [Anaerolineae bacterium]